MSLLTGDHVNQCFFRIASDLSGVVLTKPELEAQLKPVSAEVVDYPQNEIAAQIPDKHAPTKEKDDSGCSIQ